jgi:hypothetical protein
MLNQKRYELLLERSIRGKQSQREQMFLISKSQLDEILAETIKGASWVKYHRDSILSRRHTPAFSSKELRVELELACDEAGRAVTLATLDNVFSSMNTFFGDIPMDSHIIEWAVSKQDSFVTVAMASYLTYRKICEADKNET